MRPLGMVLENEMNVVLISSYIKTNIGIYFLWGNKKKNANLKEKISEFFRNFVFFSVLKKRRVVTHEGCGIKGKKDSDLFYVLYYRLIFYCEASIAHVLRKLIPSIYP